MAAFMRLRAVTGRLSGLEICVRSISSDSAGLKSALIRRTAGSFPFRSVFANCTKPSLTRYYAASAVPAASPAVPSEGRVEYGGGRKRERGVGVSRVRTEISGSLDEELQLLDDQVRRWGRVDKEQLQSLWKIVKDTGSVTPEQSIMLLRCTGTLLVKESAAERAAIFDETFKLLQSIGAETNIQVYNTILRVKLENRQLFSPGEVLEEIEGRLQLIPNRVTYQMLIGQFCSSGDIEGASKILEHMKKNNLPINEAIFNWMIRGYIKKGDVPSAKQVLTSMREGGLEPSAETFKQAVCALAEIGDTNGVNEMLAEAEKTDASLTPRHMFEVITSLALNDHTKLVQQRLNEMRHEMTARYNQDALNSSFQMIANGKDDAALETFLSLDRSRYELDHTQSLGRVFIRAMIIKKRPVETVVKFAKRLEAENLESNVADNLAILSCAHQTPDYALSIMDKLQSENSEMKLNYFRPILSAYAKRADTKGVAETVSRIAKLSSNFEGESLSGTIYLHSIRELIRRGEKLDSILTSLKTAGMQDSDIADIECAALIDEGKLDEAVKFVASKKSTPTSAILKSCLAKGFLASNCNIPALISLLKSAGFDGLNGNPDVNTFVLIGVFKMKDLQKETAESLASAWIDSGLNLFRSYEGAINQGLTKTGVSDELIQKLESLYVDTRSSVTLEKLKAASVSQLESWLEKASQTQLGQKKTFEKWLLVKYCEKGEVAKADKLKTSLLNEGFIFQEHLLLRLGNMAARDKENLQEAQEYLQQIQSKYPTYSQYTSLVLRVANLQLKENKYEDAMTTLKDYSTRHNDYLKQRSATDGYALAGLCSTLLSTCQEYVKDVKLSRDLMNAMFELGFVMPGTFSVLQQHMKSMLANGDGDEILSTLQMCISQYDKAPLNDDVFRFFIAKDDLQRLQTAVDLVTVLYGEKNVLLHLVYCFIECGKQKQARKILDTPGLRATMAPLLVGCDRFIEQNKVKELEQLVELTKGLYNIDREEMLFQLVRLHAKNKEPAKMMEAFSLFDEEGVQPKGRTLRYVANVLKSSNLPVPFEVPLTDQAIKKNEKKGEKGDATTPRGKTGKKVTVAEASEVEASATEVKASIEATTGRKKSKKQQTTATAAAGLATTVTAAAIAGAAAEAKTSGEATVTSGKKKTKKQEAVVAATPEVELSSREVEVLEALNAHDIDKAMQMIDEANAEGKEEGLKLIKTVIQKLQAKQHHITLRRLMFQLAERGDIESLKAIQQLNTKAVISNYLSQNMLRAHFTSDRSDEIISHLKSDLPSLPKYITVGALDVTAEKYSDKLPALESLINDYAKTNTTTTALGIKPVGDLYYFYLLNNRTEKAAELLKNYPAIKDKISLRFICKTSRDKQKEEVLHQVIKQHRGENNAVRLSMPYNYLVGLKCDQGDWKQALEIYEAGAKDGVGFGSFWSNTLKQLQMLLETNKQPVPWTNEALNQKADAEIKARKSRMGNTKSSSSSDSSSDSDNEKKS